MEISKANGQMDTALANISQRTSETQASLNIQTDRSQSQGGDDGQQRGVSEKSTGREIRQIPSEEAMRLAEYFRDVIGMIFDKES
ncbi:flagellar protein FlaG [Campylobacter jejuni]|nr:flagellar protein FlaG [Campylobacter jejuni]